MEKTCDQCKCTYESVRISKHSFCSYECRYRHKRLATPLKSCCGCSAKVTRVGTGYKYCDKCIHKRQADKKVAHSLKENADYKRKPIEASKRTEKRNYFPDRDTSYDGSSYF